MRDCRFESAQELMRALHCQAPSQRRHFFTALLYWRPQPSQPAAGAADADDAKATESDAPQPTVGGSLVIQNLWKFGADAASTLAERSVRETVARQKIMEMANSRLVRT